MRTHNPNTPARPRGASPFVFWWLTLMGLAALTPCVVLPEWREYQALRMVEQTAQGKLDEMREADALEKHSIEALQADPAAIARLAQRDLGFRRIGEQVVTVDVEDVPFAALNTEAVVAPEPPAWLTRAGEVLPGMDYDRVFLGSDTRRLIMGMSVALLVLAFAIHRRSTPLGDAPA
ncbi:MAG: hypothetical protein AABZ12_07365 [Planctomycetota bacterium]